LSAFSVGACVAGFGILAGFAELREQRKHLPNVVFGYCVAPLSTYTANARHAKLGAPDSGSRRMQKR
jgi:hypothetical protein